MAELAASIIGIVSAGTKVTLVLSQLAADVGSAGKEARMIGGEIRSFCAVVKTLGETLEKVEMSQYYAHCAAMIKDMTDASLEMFTEILNVAESLRTATKGKAAKDGKFSIIGRVQWAVFQKPKISMLRAAIEAYKSNLALMLGTLNTAEKVTRRMSRPDSLEVIAEEEQDRSLLLSLELEHQASMIELEQAEQQYEETESSVNDEKSKREFTDFDSTPSDEGYASLSAWTEQLVGSARDEIESIRSSLSWVSDFNPFSLQAQISRHSHRLSTLMTEDQTRISQRWSTVLPPLPSHEEYSVNAPDELSNPAFTVSTYLQKHPSDVEELDQVSRASIKPAEAREGQLLDASTLSFYINARNFLKEQPTGTRNVLLDLLNQERWVDQTTTTNSTPLISRVRPNPLLAEQAERTKQSPEPLGPTKINHRKTPQDVIRLVRESVSKYNATIQEGGADAETQKYGFTLDIGNVGIEEIPEQIVGIIQDQIERLAFSHNLLSQVPRSLALCQRLRYLNLRSNNFRAIPDTLLRISSLEILDLARNKITAIPPDISLLRNLKVLSVARNSIQTIPLVIGQMDALQILKCDGNPIISPPPSILDLSSLTFTFAHQNEADAIRTVKIKRYLGELIHPSPVPPKSLDPNPSNGLLTDAQSISLNTEWSDVWKEDGTLVPVWKARKQLLSRLDGLDSNLTSPATSPTPYMNTSDTEISIPKFTFSHRASRSEDISNIKDPGALSANSAVNRRRSHLDLSEKRFSTLLMPSDFQLSISPPPKI